MDTMAETGREAAAAAEDSPERSSDGGLLASLVRLLGGVKGSGDGAREPEQPASPTAERQSRRMMGNLQEFSRLRMDDVLVPRADIVAIDASAPLGELFDLFVKAQHSRLPVYRETMDDILGMVHIKDLLCLLRARAQAAPEDEAARPGLMLPGELLATRVEDAALMRPVLFAPPSMPAGDLLLKMQSQHLHMAIVVDEYGGTEGIVTIEDLVEEIVGEISDEHDDVEETLIRPVRGGYVVSARAEIADLEKLLKIDLLPEDLDEETDTVGGLIFALAGRVPVRGEIIRHDSGAEFEILEADPRRIRSIRVLPPGTGRRAT